MSGNWLKLSVNAIGLCLALFTPAAASAQDEARSTSATLDTVVVTASRTEQSIREVSSNVTVISEKQIQNSTAKNLADLMKQQGFYAYDTGSVSNIQIRGVMDEASNPVQTEARVQILINGRKTGITNLTPVGLNNVERIEIIRGPAAVQFGSSAMGGVINIITKRGKEGEFWAAAESGVGSFDFYKNSLGFGGAANNIDFSAGITHLKRGDYESSAENMNMQPFYSYDGNTTMNLDLGYSWFEKHRLGLNFNHFRIKDMEWVTDSSNFVSWGYLTEGFVDIQNNNLAISYEGAAEDDQFNWSAVYSFGKDKNNTFMSSVLYGDDANYEYQDIQAFTGQVGYNGRMVSANIGLDYNSFDVQTATYGNYKSDDFGTFLSGRLRLLDESLIFSAGGRYDRFTLDNPSTGDHGDKTHFAPSIGVAYLPLDWLKLRSNYSEGFSMPSGRQIYGDLSSPYPTNPNPDLSPEESKTFEFGADIDWKAMNAGLTYFQTNWDNKIIGDSTGGWHYINLKKSTLAGLEFSISGDIGEMLDQSFELRPYLNLTYFTSRKNKDRDHLTTRDDGVKDDTIPNTPEYTLNYGVTFNHPGHDLMANINGTYVGKTLVTTQSAPRDYYTYGTVSVDLSLEKGLYDFTDQSKLKLRAEVNNLFNNDNMLTWGYPGPERNFYVGLKFEYN